MQIFVYFKSITNAMVQIFFLGMIGFLLAKKRMLSKEGLTGLAFFLIEVTLPSLIFCQMVRRFSFSLYPNWWLFIFLSLGITTLGLSMGYIFGLSIKDNLLKKEFISLVTFQNSGYLPLTLVGWILPREQLSTMLI